MSIQIKRVYDPPDPQDGYRVLVDRLWPRGLTKEQLKADLWLKEAAPSTALRKWFHQDMQQWEEFRRRYFTEMDERPDAVAKLLDLVQDQQVTLLFASRDVDHNHALALKEYLLERIQPNI